MSAAQEHERARDPIAWFARQAQSLTEQQRAVLGILAVAEPAGMSALARSAARAGLRETATRQMATTSLRPILMALMAKGLVRHHDQLGYQCGTGLRAIIMRWLAPQPESAKLFEAAEVNPYLDTGWAAIFVEPAQATTLLRRSELYNTSHPRLMAHQALGEAFDEAWFEALPEDLRLYLGEQALQAAERWYLETDGGLARCLSGAPHRGTALAISAAAGLAVLRGDRSTLERISIQTVHPSIAPLARCALAMVDGNYGAACNEALSASAKVDKNQHPGVLTALQLLALQRESPSVAKAPTDKLLRLGTRRDTAFEGTFRALKRMLTRDPLAGTPIIDQASLYGLATDCLQRLMQAMSIRTVGQDGYDIERLHCNITADVIPMIAKTTYRWLNQQYLFEARRISHLIGTSVASATPSEPEKDLVGHSIFDVLVIRAPWEMALDKLTEVGERASNNGSSLPSEAEERISWRITPIDESFAIEPYLQKRGSNGQWTAGRKLAIKHLIDDAALRNRLPDEDGRIATFGRMSRRMMMGYPETLYQILPGAWAELIGHPRVFLGHADTPTEVVRGAAKIKVRTEGSGIAVSIDPPGLNDLLEVRAIENRLVVYVLPPEMKAVLAALGSQQVFPPTARARVLRALDGIARLLPIDSTEESEARQVQASTTPILRLVPKGSELDVSLFVRPLGLDGPHCEPGAGAVTLVGSVNHEIVRTERLLGEEKRLAMHIVASCPPLAEAQGETRAWRLGREESLELVAALQALGNQVIVEWPQGQALRLRARLKRSSLRGEVRRAGSTLLIDADLGVDADLTLTLEQLLSMVATGPSRFVRIAEGEYIELEGQLRAAIDSLSAARPGSGKNKGLVLPMGAIRAVESLSEAQNGLVLDKEARDWCDGLVAAFSKSYSVPRGLTAELRAYQLEGFQWLSRLAEVELGACLADDMGLGKTVQLIALLLHRAKLGPALVVAPTSVCDNWSNEINRFAPTLRIRTYWGADRAPQLDKLRARDVVLTSYAILQQDAAALQNVEWSTAVLDEAQLIKNPDTLRAKAAYGLTASMRVAATGTPIENHLGDIVSIFQFLNLDLLGTTKQNRSRVDGNNVERRAELQLLQPFILRRTKSEVLQDLPLLTEIQHQVTLSAGEAALYETLRKRALRMLDGSTVSPTVRIQVLAELTRLRRLCCHPDLVAPGSGLPSSKLNSFIELAEELVKARHRVLVFSQFTDVLAIARDMLTERGITHQYLDGSTPQKQRSAAVDAFQNGEGDVFLISLRAGGFGLNLTGADYVIHLDPWWNPAVEAQASGRAHRIGQTRPVTVYRLVTQGTIESRIVEMHREKRDLAESILEGADRSAKLTGEDLRSLLDAEAL